MASPIEAAPLLTFAEAKSIGEQMHDRWETLTGKAPLSRDDMAWGDLVQFVIRKAREASRGS